MMQLMCLVDGGYRAAHGWKSELANGIAGFMWVSLVGSQELYSASYCTLFACAPTTIIAEQRVIQYNFIVPKEQKLPLEVQLLPLLNHACVALMYTCIYHTMNTYKSFTVVITLKQSSTAMQIGAPCHAQPETSPAVCVNTFIVTLMQSNQIKSSSPCSFLPIRKRP